MRGMICGKPIFGGARLKKGVPRFQDPSTLKTWSGIGRPPKWFKDNPNAINEYDIVHPVKDRVSPKYSTSDLVIYLDGLGKI